MEVEGIKEGNIPSFREEASGLCSSLVKWNRGIVQMEREKKISDKDDL